MFGVVIAFQNYNPWLGFAESPFVGFEHFRLFITGPYFSRVMLNMLVLNFLLLLLAFPAPILFALLLNELGVGPFKKITQTISYLPHFISTVVIVGSMMKMFSYSGVVNKFIIDFGGKALPLFSLPGAFRPLYVGSDIWQGMGWGSIVYLAAIAGINPELYEAATIDGASRFQKVIYITLPSILATIMILFVVRVGDLSDEVKEVDWVLHANHGKPILSMRDMAAGSTAFDLLPRIMGTSYRTHPGGIRRRNSLKTNI